jgi:hypothetical protein
MVRNQDDTSFVSWTATLHPESAASSIDPRFQSQAPWATVYNETCSDIPVAVEVVPVDDDIEGNPQQPQDRLSAQHDQGNEFPESLHDDTQGTTHPAPYRPQPWKHSNLIDLIIGFTLALSAFLVSIKIELTAILIYTLAAGFHFVGEEICTSPALLLGKAICLTVTSVLMIVDAILLTVSVLVTELLGGIALLLCTLFGGPRSGSEWHQ